MKIGIFGGTFDPIHFGHINLCLEMKEKRGLDEIWLIPARVNPFKLDKQLQPFELRHKMVELAIEGIPGFKVHDIENQREGPSFTVDSVRQLTSAYPDYQFRLIMSDETADHFHQWKDPNKIATMAPLLIGTRHYHGSELPKFQGITIKDAWTPIRVLEISATDIRSRLKQGLYCGHLIPHASFEFIKSNNLYLN